MTPEEFLKLNADDISNLANVDKDLVLEALSYIHGAKSELLKNQMRCAMMMTEKFTGDLFAIELKDRFKTVL